MMIYELINLLPDDVKNLVCMYSGIGTSNNLLLMFRLNTNIMLIDKSHYEYNYSFYIILSCLNKRFK